MGPTILIAAIVLVIFLAYVDMNDNDQDGPAAR